MEVCPDGYVYQSIESNYIMIRDGCGTIGIPSVAHFKKHGIAGPHGGIRWGIWIESFLFLKPAEASVDI
jgi:hypothetical protein